MKCADLITSVRASTQQLWDSYQLYLSSGGAHGLNCFTPEALERKLNRTDEEIIALAEKRGLYIEDKDEYLAGLNKETE